MDEKNIIPKWLSLLHVLALCWLMIAGLLALQLWPDLPHEKLQWFLLIAFGPPLYVFSEVVFGWLFSPEHGHTISPRALSLVRVLSAFPLAFAWLAFCWWVSWLITH